MILFRSTILQAQTIIRRVNSVLYRRNYRQIINDYLIDRLQSLSPQYVLGTFYLWFTVFNAVIVERGINGGVASLADFLGVNAYVIVIFTGFMAMYCYARNQLPIYYIFGALPIVLYALYIFYATIFLGFQLLGLLAMLAYGTFPFLFIIGVVQSYRLKKAFKSIHDLQTDLKDIQDKILNG